MFDAMIMAASRKATTLAEVQRQTRNVTPRPSRSVAKGTEATGSNMLKSLFFMILANPG
jgi:hypothetical protein